jgi:hypothetical protein
MTKRVHSFSIALCALKEGERVQRNGWNGKGMHVELYTPDEDSKMSVPFLYLVTPHQTPGRNATVPWLASQTDILAEDWVILGEE